VTLCGYPTTQKNEFSLIAYDIQNNKIRDKIAKKLLYLGLTRIQYSVFAGPLQERLEKDWKIFLGMLNPTLNQNTDRILMLPVHSGLLLQIEQFGTQNIDLKLVFGMQNTLIL